MKRNVRKIKLSGKISFTALMIAVTVSLLVSGISIYIVKGYLLAVSQSHTMSVAKMAAETIDGEQINRIQEGEEETDDYQIILAQLQTFLLDEDVAYIYTMRKQGESLQFVVDADTEDGAAIGEEYETYDKIEMAFEGKPTLDKEVTTDEWGSFYSAFAPIMDEKGQVIAIVGVDCSVGSINDKVQRMTKILLIVELLCVLATLIISLITGHVIARNVLKINRKMEELAGSDGDLTQEIQICSGDELENTAKNFNSFIVKLRGMMLSVKENGNKLEQATDQTNQELQQATDGLNQIAQTLNEMTQAMQETSEFVSGIQGAAQGAKGMSADLYQQTRSKAEYAGKVSQTAEQAKQTCQQSKEQMSQVVGEISDSLADKIAASSEINKIMQLTNDIISISDQTQLLALNASIEAARAGEEGRGFAVVAEEIGKLADDTSRTAKEIESINRFTVDTVDELVQTAEKMLQYIENVVGQDYDQMVVIGQSYYRDSVEFMNQLNQFRVLSEQLSGNMGMIEEHISQIMSVIEEETTSITNVTETSEKIYGTMQTASTNGEINKQIVSELGGILAKFIV